LTDHSIKHELSALLVQQALQALFILAGIVILTYLGLSRLLLSPLHELHRVATSYGKGDLSARTLVRSDDEIGMLASTLNKMAEQVAEKIREVEESKTALQESEAFRRRIFESSALPITIIDAATLQFVDCNPAALVANGCQTVEEYRRMSILDISAPIQYDGTPSAEKAEQYLKAVLHEGNVVVEWRHQRPDGEQWDGEVHLVSFSIGTQALVQTTTLDITERKKTAALMVQTEKMMMVGGLAAGMAHEINNPLGIITQTAQNIQRRLNPNLPANQVIANELGLNLATLQQYLEARQIFSFITSIREATDRAARIISNMLKFSRKSESFTEYADVTELIDQVLELAASDYDLKKNYDFKRITIVRDIPPALPKIPVSVLEVEQVLLNLLKNAAQAMYEANTQNPRITLRAQCENGFAVINVEDNGPGMPIEVQKRIFEPFYTTKEVGKGTGLGLSVSYSIISTNHSGRLEVYSQPGEGTCFTIRLPLQRNSGDTKGASA
jgi:PAS domain S-box-containing protein